MPEPARARSECILRIDGDWQDKAWAANEIVQEKLHPGLPELLAWTRALWGASLKAGIEEQVRCYRERFDAHEVVGLQVAMGLGGWSYLDEFFAFWVADRTAVAGRELGSRLREEWVEGQRITRVTVAGLVETPGQVEFLVYMAAEFDATCRLSLAP